MKIIIITILPLIIYIYTLKLLTLKMLHPLLTYNPLTQSPQLNHNIMDTLLGGDRCAFINVIDVRKKDYGVFTSLDVEGGIAGGQHGVYVSEALRGLGGGDGQGGTSDGRGGVEGQVRYLILPYNDGKVPEKYHELFASLMLCLGSVGLFDISSKYIRHVTPSTTTTATPISNNYVIMNTNGGQVYRIALKPNNSMQILHKLPQNPTQVPEQFLTQPRIQHNLKTIITILQSMLNNRACYKNYINFQELVLQFVIQIGLREYVEKQCKQYGKLVIEKQKLSLKQMTVLQKCVQDFTIMIADPQTQTLLPKIKKYFQSQLRTMNINLTQKFLLSLKNNYFSTIGSLSELTIKKQLSQKILLDYGISSSHIALVCAQVSERVYRDIARQYQRQVEDKDTQVQRLKGEVGMLRQELEVKMEQVRGYEERERNFMQINKQYMVKCEQVAQQQQQITQHLSNIDQLKNKLSQDSLHKQLLYTTIAQLKTQTQQLNSNTTTLQSELFQKQSYIKQQQTKINILQQRVQNYNRLQSQVHRYNEQLQQKRLQIDGYRTKAQEIENKYQQLIGREMEKINHMLRKNYQQYVRVREQSESRGRIVEEMREEVEKLRGELEEERVRGRWVQQQLRAGVGSEREGGNYGEGVVV